MTPLEVIQMAGEESPDWNEVARRLHPSRETE